MRGAELVERRTAHETVFGNSDGSLTVEVSRDPVHYESGDGWERIDSSVVGDDLRDGWLRSAANEWIARFGPGGVEVMLASGREVGWVPIGGRFGTPVPGVDGRSVIYREVWPGADVRYEVTATGLKEEVILTTPPSRWVDGFSFAVSGLALTADGEVRGGLSDAAAEVAITPPVIYDASGADVTAAAKSVVSATAGERGSQSVRVAVDPVWLAALPASVFPVVVDPTVVLSKAAWQLYNANGTTLVNQYDLRSGNPMLSGCNTCYWRSIAQYNTSSWFGAKAIANGTLNITRTGGTSTGQSLSAWSTWTWSYGGAGSGNYVGNGTLSSTLGISVPQSMVQGWLDTSTQPMIGFVGNETSGVYTYQEFGATLTMVINDLPPASQPLTPQNASWVVPRWPGDPGVYAGDNPTVTGSTVTDPNGQGVQYFLRVSTDPSGEAPPGGSVTWDSGWLGSPSVQVPIQYLRDGVVYYWRWYTTDGVGPGTVAGPVAWFRFDRRFGGSQPSPYDTLGPFSANLATGNVVWSWPGRSFPSVGGGLSTALTYNSHDTASTDGQVGMPSGWSASFGTSPTYVSANIKSGSVAVRAADGSSLTFKKNGSGNWEASEGETAVLTATSSGGVQVQADDGMHYTFDSSGKLAFAYSSFDDRKPGATRFSFDGTRLRFAWDPVASGQVVPSGSPPSPVPSRRITFRWGGDTGAYACPAETNPSFTNAPAGFLCQIDYPDGTSTIVHYAVTSNHLARIEDKWSGTDSTIHDFAYDSRARIVKYRDPLGAETVAYTGSDTDRSRWLLSWRTDGRVSQIQSPQPDLQATSGAGTVRQRRDFAPAGSNQAMTVYAAGLTPPVQTANFDTYGRATTVSDSAGLSTTRVWVDQSNARDRLHYTDTADGMRTRTVYDTSGRPINTLGPWLASSVGTGGIPGGVPNAQTAYDEGVSGTGLAVSWFTNAWLDSVPTLHETAAPFVNWGAGRPANLTVNPDGSAFTSNDQWGARYTGTIDIPTTGTWNFVIKGDGPTRLIVDDWIIYQGSWNPPVDGYGFTSSPTLPVTFRRLGSTGSVSTTARCPGAVSSSCGGNHPRAGGVVSRPAA